MNKRKFFNSKWEKIVISLLVTLVVLLIAVFAYNKIAEQKAIDDIMGKVNIDSGDVGYQEISGEVSVETPIKKLSEKEFTLDKEAKTISVDESLVGGSFCISSSPDGPTENDSWNVAENETIILNENEQTVMQNQEEQKVYVYYMAGVASSITNFNSGATFYTISSKAELESFASKVNAGTSFSGKTVVLTANIALSSSTSFTSIGNSSYPFAGTFNGNGFTISNLYISASSTDYIGLFGYSTGTIKNVIVSGTTITGNNYVGAIAGKSTGTIDNCKNTSIAVTGTTNYVGGIVGETTGTVKNCINSVAITGASKVGGIVGGSDSGSITIYNCKNTGNISSSSVGTGGIIGSDTGTGVTVSYCTNSGTIAITGGQDGAGGILGTTGIDGTNTNYDGNIVINNCRNTGTVSCRYSAGGMIGNTSASLTMSNCINTSQISGTRCIGGMVGYACNIKIGSSITNCYNSGKIEATQGGIAGIAGMIYGDTGSGYITISNCGNDGVIEGTIRTDTGIKNSGVNAAWYQGYCGIATGNTLKITNCYNNGNVLGYRYVCGIALISDRYTSLDGTKMKIYGSGATGRFYLHNCYNTGSFTANSSYAAGIATLVQTDDTYTKNWSGLSSSIIYIGSTYNTVYKAEETYDFLLFYDSASNLNNSKNDNLSTYPSVFVSDTNFSSATKANYVASWQTTPTILQHPYSVLGTVGSSATVSVETYGPTTSGTTTYQWYRNTTNSNSGGTSISGATSSSYTTTVQSTDYYYYCQVTSNGTTATSDAALIGKNSRTANTLSVSGKSLTYTGSAQALATVSNAQGTVYYSTSTSLNGGNYTSSGSSTIPTAVNVGTYTIYYYTPGDDTYEEKSGNVSTTISKASSTNPTLSSTEVTYDGASHTISVTGGSGGTIQYRTSTDGSNFGSWTATKPSLTNAGTLYVQARIAGDSNHNDTSATATATIKVNKASGSVVLSATSGSITYPGTTTFTVKTNTSGGTLSVSSNATGVATASISGTTVTVTAGTTSGTATITVTSAATTNYNSASATYSVSVGSGTLNVTASNYSGTYDGNAHGISVSCSGATITYATSESGTYSTTNPTYVNAGTYTTYYKVTKTGYTTVTGSKTVTISKATGSLSLSATSLTFKYGSSSQQVTATRTGDGAISATSANTNVATVSVSGTAITVAPKNVGTTMITVSVAEGTNHTAVSGTISVSVTDTTPPTVSRDVERSVVTNFYGWTFSGGAYVDNNGTLILPDTNAYAYSPYISVDYTKWLIELEFKPLTGNGTLWMGSSYYNASYTQVTSQNGYKGNGWTQTGTLNTNNSASWDGYAGYGSDVKYVRLTIGTSSTYSTGSFEVPMVRITSETSNYAGVKVNVTDDNLDTSSLKYLWSRQSTGITEAQVTNGFTNGSVIKLPYGSQGTYYLWILAKDTAGNTYLSAVDNTIRDTIKIDNPQIEAVESDEKPTSAGKEITVYSFNAENKNTSHYIQTVGGGQTEDIPSRYVGSKAYKLTKGGEITSENGQWHGVQLTTSALSNLSANTYVIVSSDYKTTSPAGLSKFEACGIAKPNWSGYYSVTAMLLDLKINSDGNWHHTSDIFKLNEATQNTNENIITSGMPNWGYSFQTGELYVDGIQWFTIPEANLNDGVAVKKWAVGNQTKEYMRNNGTTYTGNSFVTQTNGTHTLYMLTSDGMEIIKTIEVTGVDAVGPDVSITLNGNALYFGQDPDFASGKNGIEIYNNKGNGTVTITREDYNNVPNTSGKVLHIKTTGEASPGHGGFYFGNDTSANKIYISKIVAKIPVGYTINLGTNEIGNNARTTWLTSQAGTGDWETYVLYVRTGSSGNFSSTNYFYLEGGTTATTSAPVDWYLAYANLYANDLMSWTNQDKTLQGEILDANSGTVAYAFTRTQTEPTTWTTIENNEGTVRPTYTVTENGFYYLWAKDAVGNVSMTATCVERIDKEAPVVTNITWDPAGWTNGSVKLYFDATDNGSGVSEYAHSNWGYEYCTNYQTMTPSTNVSKQLFAGFWYNYENIYLQIKDQAGNIGQYKMSVSNIDKTAPIFVDGPTHTNQEYYNNAENGTALDSEAGFSVALGAYRGGTQAVASINDGTVNSDKVLKITHPAGNTQSGYMRTHYYDVSKVYVRKIYAKIPTGYTLNIVGNTVSGKIYWLTSTAGTGEWQEYSYVFITSDESKSNMDYGHAFIEGTAPTSSFDWYVATDVTYDATYIFNNAKVTYSGANAILNIEAKDTQSGTNSITVNDVAQTLTTTTTSAKADYTVSSAGTYTITATDAVGNTTTMTKTAYTITYNANGGTGSMAVEIKIDGADRTLTTNSFTRNGYAFSGWNTQANGSGTSYASSATYSGNTNVILYAQWVSVTVDDIPSYTYTGSEIKPEPVVKYNGTTLKKETDYTVGYKNNINAGTATVIVIGTGIFTGTVEKTFEIKSATPTVTLNPTSGSVNYNATNTFTVTSSVAGKMTVTSGATENVQITSGNNASLTANTASTVTYKGAQATTSATTITITVTPTDTTNYNTVTKTYSVTAVNKINTTVSVSITGETTVGKVLTATATTASDGAKSYQWWYSSTAGATSGTAISGATSSTYTVTSSVVGYYIGVTVSVAEGTNYKAGTGTAITTSKVAGTNYKDNAGNYYETLKEAFDNASSGSTITVLKDNTDSSTATVASGKTFILDTNGKTITRETVVTNEGILKIIGTGVIEKNNGVIIDNFGNLEINNVTLKISCSNTENLGIIINNSNTGDVTINSGNLIVTADDTVSNNCYGVLSYGGKITINGGNIDVTTKMKTGDRGYCVASLGQGGSIKVCGGTLKAIGELADGGKGAAAILCKTGNQLIVGTKGAKATTKSPLIQGNWYGVSSEDTFEFYSGILKGITGSYAIWNDTVTKPYLPTGYGICNDTETIDGTEYKTAYLAPYLMEAEAEFTANGPTCEYILGAERAGLTEYTLNLVSSIKFHNTIDIPTGVVNWDVSDAENNSIMAWLVSDNNGGYVLHIGAEGKIIARECDFLFYNYTNCTAISDLEILDTSSVKNMRYMFCNCQSLESLNLSSFKTSNVEEMNFMFRNCSKLTTLDLSIFDTSKVTNMDSMFKDCSALKNLDISSFNTEQVTDMAGMFFKSGLTELSLNHFNTSKVTNMEYMFSYCESLANLKIDSFDTTNVVNMKYMFSSCSSLTELDLSHFKTQNVTEMDYMFFNCSNLTNINISSFNTSNVTVMRAMFANCSKLGNIDVTHFNTSKVENMISMFNGCTSLTSLDVSSFDTSKVKSFSKMFMGCYGLTSLDLSNFSLAELDGTTGNDNEYEGVKAINVNQMFYNSKNLQSILLGKDFSRIDGTDMFKKCTSLTSIITTRTSPMTLSTDTGVESLTKLYVPSVEAETAYESATNYLTVFGANRVQPILELVGDNPVNVKFSGTYEEKGITVAGMNKNADNTYTPYGYTVSGPVIKKDGSTVSSVDTTLVGTYTLTYTIYDKSNAKGMEAVRVVEILKGNYRIESVYFETLQEAYESVTGSSATIVVEQSNEDSTTFTVASDKNITLDLNGKTITKVSRALYNEGTFNITDLSNSNGKIDATLDVLLMNKGTTNVNGGTIEVKGAENSTATCWYVIYSQETGNVNMNDGTLKIARSGKDTSSGARVIFLTNGTTTINGGSIVAEGTGAMGIHSYNDASGKIIVNGGSIKATNYAINCSTGTSTNTTTVLVTNGYIEGGYAGIGHNSTGEVKVTGGKVVSDKYGILNSQNSEIIIGDDTAPVSTTTPVIIGAESGIHLVYGTIYFTDGILKGQTSGHRGTLEAVSGYGLQYGTEVIDGATYQTEILALANWSDGKSVYSTLEEAFEKVKDGSTLKALKDITDNSTNAVVNKLITIDLSGKNVSMPNSSIKIENDGTLEIIGKSGSTITSGQDTAIINNGGKLTVGNINEDYNNFPKVEGNKQAVSGNFTINGGTLIGTNNPPYTGTPTVDRNYFEIITSKNGTKYETTIQLEQVPPEITITPSTKEPTNENVILTVKVTDNFSGVKKATYELDGEFYDLTLNASGIGKITVSENGTYTIHAEDNAGNKSSKTYEVSNIDRTPDNITSASVQDAEENKVKYATIIIENIKTDSVLPSKVVEILISNSSTGVDTGEWIPFETDTKAPWVLDTTEGNGEKTIYIWAKDNAGNISENPFVLKVILDTKLIGGTKNKIDLSFAGIDKNFDRSELRNYQISYKTGDTSANATQTELSKIDEKFIYGDKTGEKFSLTARNIKGAGKLYVVVATKTLYDKAGNVNDVAEIETDYVIDTNAPIITYDASVGNVKIADAEGNLKAITVNGKAITISNNGTYNINSGYIKAYDLAGNVAELSL